MSQLPVRRRCGEYGSSFLAVRWDRSFCGLACRRARHSWREGRGSRAIELLVKWRRERRPGSLTALAAFTDQLVRDHRDHEAGGNAARREGRR
jgi:hypothetical protein